MKAIIFAAGLGTRLKPFTDSHPKALAEVGGVPMLERVIVRLKQAGIGEMVVNVHHFASQITDFLEARDNFGVDIHISDETGLLLETGGGILKARRWLDGDEPFLAHNADILTDAPIEDMILSHSQSGADATLLCQLRTSSRFLHFDHIDRRLRGWENTKTGQTKPEGFRSGGTDALAFNGIHILSPHIFGLLEKYPAATPFSITDFYIDNCDRLKINAFCPDGEYQWFDIGKPEALAAARQSALATPISTLNASILRKK